MHSAVASEDDGSVAELVRETEVGVVDVSESPRTDLNESVPSLRVVSTGLYRLLTESFAASLDAVGGLGPFLGPVETGSVVHSSVLSVNVGSKPSTDGEVIVVTPVLEAPNSDLNEQIAL